jgi:hypothetical protein
MVVKLFRMILCKELKPKGGGYKYQSSIYFAVKILNNYHTKLQTTWSNISREKTTTTKKHAGYLNVEISLMTDHSSNTFIFSIYRKLLEEISRTS